MRAEGGSSGAGNCSGWLGSQAGGNNQNLEAGAGHEGETSSDPPFGAGREDEREGVDGTDSEEVCSGSHMGGRGQG